MRPFFDKYYAHGQDSQAVHLMKKEIKKALKGIEENDPNYMQHLAALAGMIEDYFSLKGEPMQEWYSRGMGGRGGRGGGTGPFGGGSRGGGRGMTQDGGDQGSTGGGSRGGSQGY